VVLVRWFGKPYGLEDGTMALVGLAAFMGHLWPVFFRFQGGKGVATFIGVVFGVDLVLGLATGATWLIIAFFLRYSSVASLVSAVFAPVFYLFGDRIQWYHHVGAVCHGPNLGLSTPGKHQPAARGQGIQVGGEVVSQIQRLHVGARLSEVAIHHGTVYLAGRFRTVRKKTSRARQPRHWPTWSGS
jgi:glycerol-3-phosphate acyltransferase PlsY